MRRMRRFSEAWWWCLYDQKMTERTNKIDERLVRFNDRYRKLRFYILRRALTARKRERGDAW
jgi:hypothetical protein